MATWTEIIADKLRPWRHEERRLRRMVEDGSEDWEMRDQERRCAEVFGECLEVAINARLRNVTLWSDDAVTK